MCMTGNSIFPVYLPVNNPRGFRMALPVHANNPTGKNLIFREILQNINFLEWHFRSMTGNAIPGPEMPFPDRKCHSKNLRFRRISRNIKFFFLLYFSLFQWNFRVTNWTGSEMEFPVCPSSIFQTGSQ